MKTKILQAMQYAENVSRIIGKGMSMDEMREYIERTYTSADKDIINEAFNDFYGCNSME